MKSRSTSKWYVYMVLCSDNSLYTGITNNLKRRVNEHNAGEGAKYTRSRRPVKLVYKERVDGKTLALSREWVIKQRSRRTKINMIAFVNPKLEIPDVVWG